MQHINLQLKIVLIISFFSAICSAQTYNTTDFFFMQGENFDTEKQVIDHQGNIYISVKSTGFLLLDPPTNSQSYRTDRDVVIAKFSPEGELLGNVIISGDGTIVIRAIDFDNEGNMYIGGFIEGEVRFNSENTLNVERSGNAFIAKYDQMQNLIWVNRMGNGNFNQFISHLKIVNNQIFCSLVFSGEVDLDPGEGTRIEIGSSSTALMDFDLEGNFIDAFVPQGELGVEDIITDAQNNIYVAGSFASDIDFGFNEPSILSAANISRDGFVIKYDNEKNVVWSQVIGERFEFDNISDIALNDNNELYGVAVLPAGTDLDTFTVGTASNALFHFAESGSLINAKEIVSTEAFIIDLKIDNQSNIHLIGRFDDEIDFDVSTDEIGALTPITDRDNHFLASFSHNSTFRTAAQINGDLGVPRLVIDQNNVLYSTNLSFADDDLFFGTSENVDNSLGTLLVVEKLEFNDLLDEDNDGFTSDVDCDDTNANINPEAEEIPNNSIDEDCDGNDLTSSTHEIGSIRISIFPNPTADYIYIETDGELHYNIILNWEQKYII